MRKTPGITPLLRHQVDDLFHEICISIAFEGSSSRHCDLAQFNALLEKKICDFLGEMS